jgi:glycine/D-amino acid oxidase-like deaminating enzyme/nitrite reductase/ring-hydroxylating ferredoxin subunit
MLDHLPNQSPEPRSVWTASTQMPLYGSLRDDVRTDVCVIGAGMAGLTTAYLLTQAGRSGVILEDGDLVSGETSATTAHLSNAIDARYLEIERLHGERGSRLTASSHTAAINTIEDIVRKEKIECDFERLDGYLFAGPNDGAETLREELAAVHRAGLTAVEMPRICASAVPRGRACLRFPDQAQFHPLKYLAGLARVITRDGGRIYARTHADQVSGGALAQVRAGEYLVSADAIVVATNTPINDVFAVHTKQAAYTSYVIGMRVAKGSVEKALYWDTERPYHYVRLHQMVDSAGPYDLIIVGGEDHKTGQAHDTEERHSRLRSWAQERFEVVGSEQFAWSGQVMETIDGLAFIGRNPSDKDNVFIATGDCGMGLTHGTIAGLLLRDLILGRENAWTDLYDPSRKTLRAAGRFVKENMNVARHYAQWLAHSSVATTEEISPGSGAVLDRGLRKCAVYRDESGEIHERSATCPHLGCLVDWNPGEKTWDCACHGSRFDRFGKVLHGPANRDLAE